MRLIVLAVFALCLASTVSLAQEPAPVPAFTALVAKGDGFDVKLLNQQALEAYLEAEKLQPKNTTILWKIARQYCLLMPDAANDSEQKRLGETALGYALRSATSDPHDATAQLAVAICYGRLARLMDNKTKLAYSKLVKEYADRSLALNPRDDMVHHVLGLWNYEVASLGAVSRTVARLVYGDVPTSSYTAACECFQKAIQINPKRLSHHVELGRAYAALGKKDEARQELKLGLSMPNKEKDDPNVKKKASDALEKL